MKHTLPTSPPTMKLLTASVLVAGASALKCYTYSETETNVADVPDVDRTETTCADDAEYCFKLWNKTEILGIVSESTSGGCELTGAAIYSAVDGASDATCAKEAPGSDGGDLGASILGAMGGNADTITCVCS